MLSEILKELRAQTGMSQKKFGDLVGVPAGTIGTLEAGDRNLSHDVAEKIADALDLPPALRKELHGARLAKRAESTSGPAARDVLAEVADLRARVERLEQIAEGGRSLRAAQGGDNDPGSPRRGKKRPPTGSTPLAPDSP